MLVNVSSNLASKTPKGKRLFNTYYTYLRKSVVNSFFINLVQEYKMEKLINILNQNKSIGPCSIPVSFQRGMFPKALKTVRMSPIFKKEDLQFSSNYRHISVLPIFKRLYKACMYSRLYAFLTKYELLFKEQFGVRNNQSTSHALISLIDLIKKYLDNDYFVCGVFINLQRAFDTVNH